MASICTSTSNPRAGSVLWLDVQALSRNLLKPDQTLARTKYFTSRVALPPDKAISEIMRLVKTNSSRWVHQTFDDYKEFAWQIGYGGFSVSESGRQDVCNYIAAQEEHHKKMMFEEEFLAFLKKHGVQYDPNYLWK